MADKQIKDFSQYTSPVATDKILVQKAADDTYVYVQLQDVLDSVGIVEDTTPVLGGNLTAGGYNITGIGSLTMGGTAFPGSPATGQIFYRTDLDLLCNYDGTRWLTVNRYEQSVWVYNQSSGTNLSMMMPQAYAIYYTRYNFSTYVDTTLDGSNYFSVAINSRTRTESGTTALLAATSLASDGADTWVNRAAALNTAPANYGMLDFTITKTGSPGGLDIFAGITYRYIIT